MLRTLPYTVPLLIAVAVTAQAPENAAPLPEGAPAAMALIEAKGLREHAEYLASDELGGRYTGTEGQEKTAEYIANHFKKLGLKPLGIRRGGRSYFQKYPVERTWLDPKGTRLTIGSKKHTTGFAVIPGRDAQRIKISGSFAWCGDGSPDELAGGLKRKIPVVVLDAGEAGGGAMGSLRSGMRAEQRAAAISRKAASQGAGAVVFCLRNVNGGIADSLNAMGLLPGKPLLKFNGKGRRFKPHSIPSVFLAPALSDELLKHMKVLVDGQGLDGDSASKKARGKLELYVREDPKFDCLNVAAYLEGKGRAGEAIVFSAHMDHMGTRLDGDAFNGADDNASGTSGLLTIAEAFARSDEQPNRSIVFLSVSGEELGLWGSEWYSDHPTWPLGGIVANINIDMIGRATDLSDEKGISVTPSHRHAKYSTLARDAHGLATKLGMTFSSGDTYYQRSDHYNFARKGVPVVFFCDGEHGDYHKVTDHADKLDFAKMELVSRLAFWTGLRAANASGRPKTIGKQGDW